MATHCALVRALVAVVCYLAPWGTAVPLSSLSCKDTFYGVSCDATGVLVRSELDHLDEPSPELLFASARGGAAGRRRPEEALDRQRPELSRCHRGTGGEGRTSLSGMGGRPSRVVGEHAEARGPRGRTLARGNATVHFRLVFRLHLTQAYISNNFWQIIISAGPVLIVALGIGLLIGIIQAATSINEMTLSFVPKLVLVLLTLALIANFMLTGLADYFAFIFDQIASIGQA